MGKTRETGFLRNILANDGSALTGYVPNARTLTINGTTQDLSSNRTFNIATSATLGGLTDATISSLVDNQLLRYNASTSKWVNWTPNYLTGITSSQVTTALGYTPVTNARTITINGTAYDLSADRSWTIAGGVTSFNTRTGAITLSSGDVTGALGYTPVTTARTITINGTAYDLSADRSWTVTASATWAGLSSGIRENYDLQFRPADNSSSYAGLSFATPGNSQNGGYLLIRGGADSDVYTQNGITLVADTGWLTLAQRTTASRGVRIMTGTASVTRLSITDSFSTFSNGVRFGNSSNNAYFTGNSDWGVRLVNDNGYIQFGPANNGWAHVYSDKSFYFNQNLYINGDQVLTTNTTSVVNFGSDLRFNSSTARRLYGASLNGYNAVRFEGNWDNFDVMGRVLDWTGSNLHFGDGYNGTSHSGVYFQLGSVAYFRVKGAIYADGDVIAYYSDRRLKQNIQPIQSALSIIDKIGAYTYEWNKKSESVWSKKEGDRDFGLISQEVEEVWPMGVAVQAGKDINDKMGYDDPSSPYYDPLHRNDNANEYKTVRYDKMVTLAIAAIKEQQIQIKELKSKIDELTK